MQQIEKNNVTAENQLNGAGLVSFENSSGKGIRVLFVGNSITRHAPSPSIGWTLDCGMAASAPERDYVHLLMGKFRKDDPDAAFCVCQVADWERNYRKGSETYPLFADARNFQADIIFFRFIENCPCKEFDGDAFRQEYAAFADYLNPTGKAKIICSSSFWKHTGDGIMQEVAAERRYPFVDLGDLGESDQMKAIGRFEHVGVANHPGDRGMEAIAERLWNAAKAEIEDKRMLPSILRYTPAVCAVKNNYQILVPVSTSCVLWVRVGEKNYYDDSNGILRSDTELHRVSVPMTVLDKAGEYTVCWREVVERKPYFPVMGEEQSATFAFRPIQNDPIRAYMIADAHGMFEEPVGAAKKFEETYGKIDLLILNGDILDHSGDAENFMLYYKIAEALTGGEIPVIISRGNHDLRGKCAEKLADYMPTENGNSFYSFRLGNLWGILLDCGEDKADDHVSYNGTICCHAFREQETEYLQDIIADESREYRASGVEHRIVISHFPFSEIDHDPFDIEQDIYGEWVKNLNESVKPEFLLSGHVHRAYITKPGEERDAYGMQFPTVVGSEVRTNEKYFAGCGILWEKKGVRAVLNNKNEILKEQLL